MMYSPYQIYQFMMSMEFRSIMNETFYKRHMERDDIPSPFQDPAQILFLEYLIDQNYIIALYRGDHGFDTETYYVSTLGNAFLTMYQNSRLFRLKSMLEYYRILWWIVVASAVGSILANMVIFLFIQ